LGFRLCRRQIWQGGTVNIIDAAGDFAELRWPWD
jgi:hypothetical protein